MKKFATTSPIHCCLTIIHTNIIKVLLLILASGSINNLLAQKVIIKDTDENVLMQFNDEGSTGSITFFPSTGAPTNQVNKLYNYDGDLYWEWVKIGTANEAAGWRLSNPDLTLLDNAHEVGIGTSSPLGKLHILQESNAFAFRVDDARSDLSPFIIDDTGNVGVGTISPTQKLEIIGKLKLGNDEAPESSGVMRFNTDTDEFEGYNGSSWISFGGGGKWLSNDSDIYFNTGNVGIGSASPLAKFYIIQKSTNDAFRVDDEDADATPFIIDEGGKVGMGTAAPLSKLHVEGSTGNEVALMINNQDATGLQRLQFGTNPASDAGIELFNNSTTGTQPGKYKFFNNRPSGHYEWVTGGQVKMVLTDDDRLGIGDVTPSAKTHITQINAEDAFRVDDVADDPTPFIVKDDGDIGIGIINPTAKTHIAHFTAGEDVFRVDDESSDTSPFIIKDDGKVGIGKVNPEAKIDVNGNAKISDNLIINGEILPQGISGERGQVLQADGSGNMAWVNGCNYKYFQGFLNDDTWTVPSGVNEILVELWGGGGAGGYGGGGGGGAYAKVIIDVVPGETVTITVGAAGCCPGSDGESSRIDYNSLYVETHGGLAAGSQHAGEGGYLSANFEKLIYKRGRKGEYSSLSYSQSDATTFVRIIHHGNGGDAGNSYDTGGSGGITVIPVGEVDPVSYGNGQNGGYYGGGGGGSWNSTSGGAGYVIIYWN